MTRLTKENIKEFVGSALEQMPKIVAEKRKLANIAELMQARLEDILSPMGSYESSDMVLVHPDGNVKIILDAQVAQNLNPATTLRNHHLYLPQELYRNLEGQVFTSHDIRQYCGSENVDELIRNPIALTLARDQELLAKYLAKILELKGSSGTALGVSVDTYRSYDNSEIQGALLALPLVYEIRTICPSLNVLDNKYNHLIGVLNG